MEYKNENKQVSNQKYDCLLFDLDDTIYPLTSGLSKEVTKNIQEYMLQKLCIEEAKVPELCVSLYKFYGTTLAGLRVCTLASSTFVYLRYKAPNLALSMFYSYVHGRLPYMMLKPDPVLRNLLLSLPIRKVIFTNADKTHAARVLSRLGLEDCFERIISFETLNSTDKGTVLVDQDASESERPTELFDIDDYCSRPNADLELPRTPVVCKPFEEAFEQVFKIANINPRKTIFFDDSIRNLETGKRLGLHTVWVGTSHRAEGVDYALESIHNIKEALPELWEVAGENSESISYSGKVSIETSVIA
ncbi:Catalytic/ hydrolase [Citrus sinensis]|uniref:Catalytic/ hydrolase n=1 Tax=Citrus sinensis TaxID=2711 RepID=A0ACB8IWL5_CITSI|nr:Catalytic/ hydrolase [Citrus sinensis]